MNHFNTEIGTKEEIVIDIPETTIVNFASPTSDIRFNFQQLTVANFSQDGLVLDHGPFANDDQLAGYMVGLLMQHISQRTGVISMTFGGDRPTTLTFDSRSDFLTNPAHSDWLGRLTPTQVHFMERFASILSKLEK
jgi:hypothetical protein